MSWGLLSDEDLAAIAPYIRDKVVEDLGAGDAEISHDLASIGAKSVFAIDKEPCFSKSEKVIAVQATFRAWSEATESFIRNKSVAFVCWPQQIGLIGLPRLLDRFGTVIYVGKNDDNSACGTKALWDALRVFQVELYRENERNAITVYSTGHWNRPIKDRTPEEEAAFKRLSHEHSITGRIIE